MPKLPGGAGEVKNSVRPAFANVDAGEFLRSVRRQADLTQDEMAKRLETTQAQIARWEGGKRSPTVQKLCQMLDAAGCDLTLGATSRNVLRPKDYSDADDRWEAALGRRPSGAPRSHG